MKKSKQIAGIARRGESVAASIERAVDDITGRAWAGKASFAETIAAEVLVSSLLATAEARR